MSNKLFIPVILGTNRKGRQSEKVANWIVSQISKRGDIETKLIDTRDIDLPSDDYGEDIKDQFPEFRDIVEKSDGLIIVSPEYNQSFPGHLKGALDMLLKEYKNKSVGLVGVSSGSWGGVRAIEHLLPVVRHIGLVAIAKDLHFPNVKKLFDENGEILDEAFYDRLDKFMENLVWMTKVLKWGRENL